MRREEQEEGRGGGRRRNRRRGRRRRRGRTRRFNVSRVFVEPYLVVVDVLADGLTTSVHLEDAHAAGDVGQVNSHLTVEAAGAEQSGVEHIGAVGGRQDDDAGVALEAVHLGQQLVDGLFTLVAGSE